MMTAPRQSTARIRYWTVLMSVCLHVSLMGVVLFQRGGPAEQALFVQVAIVQAQVPPEPLFLPEPTRAPVPDLEPEPEPEPEPVPEPEPEPVPEPEPEPVPEPEPEPLPEPVAEPRPRPEPEPVAPQPPPPPARAPVPPPAQLVHAAPPIRVQMRQRTPEVFVASTPPGLVREPRPRYPRRAQQRRLQGLVLLELMIEADGTLGAVRILESSGHQALDDEAVRCVRACKFIAATCAGNPVRQSIEYPIRFQIR